MVISVEFTPYLIMSTLPSLTSMKKKLTPHYVKFLYAHFKEAEGCPFAILGVRLFGGFGTTTDSYGNGNQPTNG
jgi:hypothetical protein